MSVAVETHPVTGRTWVAIGWVMSGLLIAFMIFDTAIKLLDLQVVVDTMNQLGIPPSLDRTIGAIELVCLVLYAIPRTSVLGAILFTAIFGGAITSHMRLGDPLFSHTLFGVYLGLLAWGGLWFRDERIRALLPIRH
jgi:hypothetical protein